MSVLMLIRNIPPRSHWTHFPFHAITGFENSCFVEAKQLFSENKVLIFRSAPGPSRGSLFELPGVPGASQTDPPGCPREPKWSQNGLKMEPKGVNKGCQNRTFIKWVLGASPGSPEDRNWPKTEPSGPPRGPLGTEIEPKRILKGVSKQSYHYLGCDMTAPAVFYGH